MKKKQKWMKYCLWFMLVYPIARYAIYDYYDMQVEKVLNSLNAYYHYVGGPPENYVPPWKWNMVQYISIGYGGDKENIWKHNGRATIRASKDQISEIIYLSGQLCCLSSLQILPAIDPNDFQNLKNLKNLQYLQITTDALDFPEQELIAALPNTMVVINGRGFPPKKN